MTSRKSETVDAALYRAAQRAFTEAKATGNEPLTWANGVGVGIATMQAAVERELAAIRADSETVDAAHCPGCRGWIEPEYLRREDCPGIRAEARAAALDEARAAVEDAESPYPLWPSGFYPAGAIDRHATLAAIDALRERSGE